MNKLLMLTAAALATSVSSAEAGHAILSVDGACNTYTFHWKGDKYHDTDNYQSCDISSIIKGHGIATKTKGLGRNVMVNDTYKGDENEGIYVDADFELPFRTGNWVTYYYSTNGVNWTEYLTTTYTVESPGTIHPHSRVSERDLLRATISEKAGN